MNAWLITIIISSLAFIMAMYLKHYLSYFLAFRTNNYKTKPVTPIVFGRQLLALENENAQWFLKKFYAVDFLQKWKMGHFYSLKISFRRIFFIFSLALPFSSDKILKQ